MLKAHYILASLLFYKGFAVPISRTQCTGAECDDLPDCSTTSCNCIHPSKTYCDIYYLCIDGIPKKHNCSTGLRFNKNTLTCDFDSNVNCENRTSITTRTSPTELISTNKGTDIFSTITSTALSKLETIPISTDITESPKTITASTSSNTDLTSTLQESSTDTTEKSTLKPSSTIDYETLTSTLQHNATTEQITSREEITNETTLTTILSDNSSSKQYETTLASTTSEINNETTTETSSTINETQSNSTTSDATTDNNDGYSMSDYMSTHKPPTQETISTDVVEELNFTCPSRFGLFPDTETCNYFYQCSNFIPYHMQCPSDLHFNPVLEVCDWPSDAGCDNTTSEISETSVATTSLLTTKNDTTSKEIKTTTDYTPSTKDNSSSTDTDSTPFESTKKITENSTTDITEITMTNSPITSTVGISTTITANITEETTATKTNSPDDRTSPANVTTTEKSNITQEVTTGIKSTMSEVKTSTSNIPSTSAATSTIETVSIQEQTKPNTDITSTTEPVTKENSTQATTEIQTTNTDVKTSMSIVPVTFTETPIEVNSTHEPNNNETTVWSTDTESEDNVTRTETEDTSEYNSPSGNITIQPETITDETNNSSTDSSRQTNQFVSTAIVSSTKTETITPEGNFSTEQTSVEIDINKTVTTSKPESSTNSSEVTTTNTENTKESIVTGLPIEKTTDGINNTNDTTVNPETKTTPTATRDFNYTETSTETEVGTTGIKNDTSDKYTTEYNIKTDDQDSTIISTRTTEDGTTTAAVDLQTTIVQGSTIEINSTVFTTTNSTEVEDLTTITEQINSTSVVSFFNISSRSTSEILTSSRSFFSTEETKDETNNIGQTTESFPEETSTDGSEHNFTCPTRFGLFPDPENCNYFYHCSHYISYHKQCPSNLHFNPVLQVCDWPYEANCALEKNTTEFIKETDNDITSEAIINITSTTTLPNNISSTTELKTNKEGKEETSSLEMISTKEISILTTVSLSNTTVRNISTTENMIFSSAIPTDKSTELTDTTNEDITEFSTSITNATKEALSSVGTSNLMKTTQTDLNQNITRNPTTVIEVETLNITEISTASEIKDSTLMTELQTQSQIEINETKSTREITKENSLETTLSVVENSTITELLSTAKHGTGATHTGSTIVQTPAIDFSKPQNESMVTDAVTSTSVETDSDTSTVSNISTNLFTKEQNISLDTSTSPSTNKISSESDTTFSRLETTNNLNYTTKLDLSTVHETTVEINSEESTDSTSKSRDYSTTQETNNKTTHSDQKELTTIRQPKENENVTVEYRSTTVDDKFKSTNDYRTTKSATTYTTSFGIDSTTKETKQPIDYDCPSRFGLYPDQRNCSKFYECSQWIPHHMDCPPKLHFNPIELVCDWPIEAGCDPTLMNKPD